MWREQRHRHSKYFVDEVDEDEAAAARSRTSTRRPWAAFSSDALFVLPPRARFGEGTLLGDEEEDAAVEVLEARCRRD